VKKVYQVWFSATGTTRRVVEEIAGAIAQECGWERVTRDFTLPAGRQEPLRFDRGDVVVLGTPVYAGRVPNVLLKYLATLQADGALAVPVVVYGNRDFDDALIELRDLLMDGGALPIAAGAFVAEHSFSKVLAAGRPDAQDVEKARGFGRAVAALLTEEGEIKPVEVPGVPRPYRGYYQPRDRKGNPVDIRKVKPLVSDTCDQCGVCVRLCPMGSIDPENVRAYTGICIKCGACIKGCPKGARYYDDAGYLYHQHELEEGLTRRAEPCWFVGKRAH
jgi:NAD-dependent dihydropyrimidine dehydrogenase PreA subunit/flavodoxin